MLLLWRQTAMEFLPYGIFRRCLTRPTILAADRPSCKRIRGALGCHKPLGNGKLRRGTTCHPSSLILVTQYVTENALCTCQFFCISPFLAGRLLCEHRSVEPPVVVHQATLPLMSEIHLQIRWTPY